MKQLILIILLAISSSAFASNAHIEYDSLVNVYFASAKKYMELKKYDSAQTAFKNLFKLKNTIPDEAAYYYGLNQFYRTKYKQAQQGFEKYIRLLGDKGKLFDSSMYYIARSQCFEKGYVEVKEECNLCHGTSHSKIKCLKCKGVGKEYCSVCSGSGVIISRNNFGDSYQKCYKCEGTGITLCSVCHGTTFQDGDCPQCSGKGYVLMRKDCK
jgi:tetratricopeptide (TPR) repeat protein